MPKIMYDDKNYSVGGGGAEIETDSELNEFSENPVQNKAVAKALKELSDKLNISDIVFATKQDIDELFSMQ